jgi:hypothetical protein
MKENRKEDFIFEKVFTGKIKKNSFGKFLLESLDDGNLNLEVLIDDFGLDLIGLDDSNITITINASKLNDPVQEDEQKVVYTLKQLCDSSAWDRFVEWQGWSYYVSDIITISGNDAWNEKVEVPISLAKKWGLL